VTDHETAHVDALRDRLHRDPVEAESSHAPLFPPDAGDGVGRGRLGEGRMEGRVEYRDVGNVGSRGPRRSERL
jgi:hypothetical protein